MQQPPPGQGWPQQGYGQLPTSYGQLPSPYPPQQGQWQQPYGQPPPQQPKKKSGKLKWVLISLGVVLILCIGACALVSSAFNYAAKQATTGNVTTNTTSSSNTTSSNTTSSSNSTSTQVGKVGDTITVDSVGCTLVSVNKLAADEITKPKPGNQFIAVHIKIHNNNSQQTTYNPFDFHVKNGAGNVTDEELVPPSSYAANNELNSGQLDPGGSVEGDIIFQVPIGDHKAEFTWQPNIFGNSTQNAWNLGL